MVVGFLRVKSVLNIIIVIILFMFNFIKQNGDKSKREGEERGVIQVQHWVIMVDFGTDVQVENVVQHIGIYLKYCNMTINIDMNI